jgi:hypothetical protein
VSIKFDQVLNEVQILNYADDDLFTYVADYLCLHLNGTWVAQINGLNQRYWDLETASGRLTLHSECTLGISLYVDFENKNPAANAELLRAYELLKLFELSSPNETVEITPELRPKLIPEPTLPAPTFFNKIYQKLVKILTFLRVMRAPKS